MWPDKVPEDQQRSWENLKCFQIKISHSQRKNLDWHQVTCLPRLTDEDYVEKVLRQDPPTPVIIYLLQWTTQKQLPMHSVWGKDFRETPSGHGIKSGLFPCSKWDERGKGKSRKQWILKHMRGNTSMENAWKWFWELNAKYLLIKRQDVKEKLVRIYRVNF